MRFPKILRFITVRWRSIKKALFLGRDIYVKEACWHCHSQYIRPVGNESSRYGLVSVAGEYQNQAQPPPPFWHSESGTRSHQRSR